MKECELTFFVFGFILRFLWELYYGWIYLFNDFI